VTARSLAIGAGVCFVAGAAVGILAYRSLTTPRVQIVTELGPARTVLVDRPTLQTRDVVRVVPDRVEVARLMADATAATQQISTLVETLATLKANGAGEIRYVDRLVPGETITRREARFSDWRLTFMSNEQTASYTLSQRFEVLSIVGKTSAGRPTATTRLFEIGPGEARTALTDVQTTTVAATPDAPRWHFRANLAAGVGYAGGLAGMQPGAVVGLRWLSYGTSRAAEDGRWAVASPVLWLDTTGQQVGVLPVSVNLGQIPRQPFRDLWLGGFIGITPQPLGVGKIGVVLHATF
jgi:hypothetical protein